MKSIILCEGETDQIILSYYFKNQFLYEYDRVRSNKIKDYAKVGIPYSYKQKTDNKRKHSSNELIIWNVAGRDNLPSSLAQILKHNSLNTDRVYKRIIVIADKDDTEESAKFWDLIRKTIAVSNIKVSFTEDDWFNGKQACSFGATLTIDFLMLNVPAEGNGALETFLLYALQERSKADQYIAKRAQEFVKGLVKNSEKFENKYLNHRRLRTKAPLAVYFGITSPDRVFAEMNKMLEAINWEKYKTIQQGFEKLNCFK